MASFPVPVVLEVKASEEFPSAEEGLTQGVKKKTLSETPRPGKEVVLPFGEQFFHKRSLVHIVKIVTSNLLKALDSYGKFLHDFLF